MIHGSIGASSAWMAHQQVQRHQYPQAEAGDAFDGKAWGDDRCDGARQQRVASDCGVGYHIGHFRNGFSNFVGAAVFADRVNMEKRIEFRTEMSDIRSEIRSLMDGVEGGQLSTEQQGQFDELVGKIVDLRESYGFRSWRNADPEKIAARILDRFGVEPAPEGADGVANPDSVGMLQDQVMKLTELVTSLQETLQNLTEKLSGMQSATTDETPTVDDIESTAVTELVEETPAVTTETEAVPETKPAAEITTVETLTESDVVAESDEVTANEGVSETDEAAGDAEGDPVPDAAALAEKLAGVIANASTMMDELLEALAA